MTFSSLYWLKIIALSVLCLIAINVLGQQDETLTIPSKKPIVKLANRFKPRPKILEFELESLSNFKVEALSDQFGDGSAVVSQNLIRGIKGKFPIILKEGLNLIGGLGYRHEQFKFRQQSDPQYPLFERFEDKSLKRISFSSYLKKDLVKEHFLFAFMNSSLNSDLPRFKNFGDQLKLSLSFIYGKNLSLHKLIGAGVSFGYDFGNPRIFPLFIFNNDFSQHWGFEFLLPKSVKLRYSPTNFNHFFATTELQGASYNLQDSVLAGFNRLEFRRSSIRLKLTYEREIHDWLWAGFTVGYRIPINLFLSEPDKGRNDSIIMIEAKSDLYYNFSIFFVPPAKLYKRAKSGG